MTIKSVAILGAGAVGSYCIYGLSKCDIQLSVIAKDERYERLKKNGCLINNIMYHPEVLTPEEAHGVDLLIVCLKYNALPDALEDIKQIVDERCDSDIAHTKLVAREPFYFCQFRIEQGKQGVALFATGINGGLIALFGWCSD